MIYGRERVAPKWISKRKSLEGGNEVLWLLGLVGHGEVSNIYDVRINGNPAYAYPSIATEARGGTADQTVIKGFETVGQLYDANTKMETGVNFIHQGRQAHDSTVFAVTFQRGIYFRNNNGIYAAGNSLYVERKKFGGRFSVRHPSRTSGKGQSSGTVFCVDCTTPEHGRSSIRSAFVCRLCSDGVAGPFAD